MKLNNMVEANEFLKAVNKCKGHVELRSSEGDVYNLRSRFMQYIVVGVLINSEKDNLELYCSNREDEAMFMEMFKNGKLKL